MTANKAAAIMKAPRRTFLEGMIAAAGAAFLPTALCAAEDDWKAAFRCWESRSWATPLSCSRPTE